jgi:DNA polymerase-3 subunit alpha
VAGNGVFLPGGREQERVGLREAMAAQFVHLHVHSQYSFLASTIKLGELGKQARALGMPAVALTDHANMYGAIRHWRLCQAAGVQPILGCELNITRDEGGEKVDHLIVLAASQVGYRNLVKLVSRSYTEPATPATPCLKLEQVAPCTAGLVGLSGCLNGVVPQQLLEFGAAPAEALLGRLRDMFEPGQFFVELQDHGFPEQPILNGLLAAAARRLDLPLLATNDVHFLSREDGEALMYLDCIRKNTSIVDERASHHGSFEMYLKSPTQMAALFRDWPEATANTLKVAEMCTGLQLELGRPMLPRFPVPEGYDTEGYFRYLARTGLQRRFEQSGALGKQVDEEAYRGRLEHELDVIVRMGFAGYFLIVWDFIREAKQRGIPVGPGRGSGAGSLVAYALDITELDPISYGLLFERFLNPERISLPDFDIDFCMAQRDQVISYVAEKYGKECVGQIATFQNLKARSVIKDVARTMGIAPGEAQRIANLVPALGQGKTATISQALEQEPKLRELAETEPSIDQLLSQARKLEGLTRHAGTHAAGVVISDGPLEQVVPCFTNDGAMVTQYDKKDVEEAGLVKFDFLGLKTLTVIHVAERLVNARPDRRERPLDLGRIRLDDRASYALIASGETTGIFQLESLGMQQMLKRLRPDCFEDIIAAVALYRPGPMSMKFHEQFIDVKHGRLPMRKVHPQLAAVLGPTYGVPVYQEQVMQIAQHLAGYSLGAADVLRRAMGKKDAAEMAEQRKSFVDGAVDHGVGATEAARIFDEVKGFAEYGFNKSHSAAYALITYQTAFLKAHYPAEFFAAQLTVDQDKIEKVVRTIAEARAWGVSVLPPDINASELDFTVVYTHPDGDGPARASGRLRDRLAPQIRFGLGALRGVGQSTLESVFEARQAGGAYRDLFDLAARVDARRLNRGVLEALVQCGAFDSVLAPLGISRARAFAAVERALERARSASRDRERGQTTLFGVFEAASAGDDGPAAAGDYPAAEPWDRHELLRREKEALGCYVTGHPLHRYGSKLAHLGVISTVRIAGEDPWSPVAVAGVVENYQERLFRSGAGGRVAFFEIDDEYGRVRAKLRGQAIDSYGSILGSGKVVCVHGRVSFPGGEDPTQEQEPLLLADAVEPIADAILAKTRAVSIRLQAGRAGEAELRALRQLLDDSPGGCPVEVVLVLPDGSEAILALDGTRVTPDDAMLAGLERVFGASVAELR